ncbi:caprin-2-like isoform X2 [Dreissena polymorpha]|uniref:C1q domain-containing protein n=1 Tax=Dreissena polymorpha TaxID=45954 RepID=A0A9D4E2E5_DREPO|nr:caprin-2-like isoform X2 [Dreissena polymorpha]KAH3771568.1 hypothetical protein DPMN_172893 [Dreissena polymorpha]
MIRLILGLCLISKVYGKFDPIAFTVSQSTTTFSGAATIPYSDNITIHNAATNIRNGIFTCPRDGIYKFSVFGCSAVSGHFALDLYKRNVSLATLYGHLNGGQVVSGNTVIVQLKVGDTVQVKSKNAATVSLQSSSKENTFSGVQLGSQALYSGDHTVVAFSATSNHHQNVMGNNIVQYHTKLVADGGVLDLFTGVFTVRSSGYYVLHFASTSMQNEELWLDLFVNEDYVCSIYARADFEWASASNSVVLHLSAWDKAGVFSRAGRVSRLYGSADYIFTSFSGTQIVSDEDLNNPDTEPVVIFSVGLSMNATVPSGKPVVFNRVFVDLKRAFNLNTGVFVVPVTGVYEFNYHCLARANSFLSLVLVKTNSWVNGFFHLRNTVHPFSAGNSAVLELTAGETVYVMSDYTYNYLVGATDEVYCTFSGYLLHSSGPIVIG